MHLSIEYCVRWNYLPEASRLEAELRSDPDLTIELIQGDRGVFDVRANGTLIYSKRAEGRMPSAADVRARLRQIAARPGR